jgi:choline-sulfatase
LEAITGAKSPFPSISMLRIKKHTNRFIGFQIFLTLATVVCSSLLAAPEPAQPTGYNVLLLMTDEHTPKVLGCYGDELVKTPTLDSLAAKGVRFTAAYCQNPLCVPSRVSLVSGRMPCHLDTFRNVDNQKYHGVTTLADVFSQAGYRTAWFGKTHWGNPRFQQGGAAPGNKKAAREENDESIGRLPQESQVSKEPVEKNLEHRVANEALAFLDQNKDKKFFLGVSFVKPHFPFTIQQKYFDLYQGKVTLPRAPQKLIDELPAISKQERKNYKHAQATQEEILRTKAIYYGMVTYVDEEFGRIFKKLKELGLADKTIILYTADHGEMLGNRGIWYKNSFYDGSATVPFIWSFPKELPQGKVVTAPVMNMDIFPTLCDLCKLPKPAGLEGSSLLPLMTGASDGKDRYALSENFRHEFSGRMIRTVKWKYFFYTNGDEYLYDLQADPGEEQNLARNPAYRKTVDELKARASEGWKLEPKAVRPSAAEDKGDQPGTTNGKKHKKKA